MQRNAKDEAKRWLDQAMEDLKGIAVLVKNRHFKWACYFSHLTAEIGLKGFLYGQGEDRVIGHSVTELIRQCSRYDESFSTLGTEVSGLDGFYYPTRYPDALPDSIPARVYNTAEAKRAREIAEKVIRKVAEKL